MPHSNETAGTINSGMVRIWAVEWDPEKEVWQVGRQGARRALKNFDTKAPAKQFARRKAKNDQPARLNILDKNGMIVEQPTYGL